MRAPYQLTLCISSGLHIVAGAPARLVADAKGSAPAVDPLPVLLAPPPLLKPLALTLLLLLLWTVPRTLPVRQVLRSRPCPASRLSTRGGSPCSGGCQKRCGQCGLNACPGPLLLLLSTTTLLTGWSCRCSLKQCAVPQLELEGNMRPNVLPSRGKGCSAGSMGIGLRSGRTFPATGRPEPGQTALSRPTRPCGKPGALTCVGKAPLPKPVRPFTSQRPLTQARS
jgi:hypothetical protein